MVRRKLGKKYRVLVMREGREVLSGGGVWLKGSERDGVKG